MCLACPVSLCSSCCYSILRLSPCSVSLQSSSLLDRMGLPFALLEFFLPTEQSLKPVS